MTYAKKRLSYRAKHAKMPNITKTLKNVYRFYLIKPCLRFKHSTCNMREISCYIFAKNNMSIITGMLYCAH